MQILVTGGAGYIGSHVAKALARAGHQPIVLDDLSTGHLWAVRWGALIQADIGSYAALVQLFRDYKIDAVIHLAAVAYVGESMMRPAEYFQNNYCKTHCLLEAMRTVGVTRIVFSSSCATYGDPQSLPISEKHPQNPTNPYGESKRMVERTLEWYQLAYGLEWVSLRYFNAAGADPDCEIGELHDPETHLIPGVIGAAYTDMPPIQVFGTTYGTADGTAVRDFVHVSDLAAAHVTALELLASKRIGPDAFNLGTGVGHSVRDVIAAVEKFTCRPVPVIFQPPRAGDPAILVADATKAIATLGWAPKLSSMESIVQTARQWHERLRGGQVPSVVTAPVPQRIPARAARTRMATAK